MRSRIVYIIVVLSVYSAAAFSQNCETPLPPGLRWVSVQPETGWVSLQWERSPSGNIAAYIIYEYNEKQAGWIAIDTVWDQSATTYEYRTIATKYFKIDFVVAAYRLPLIPGEIGCPSELSNVLSTIFAEAESDSCKGEISIKWNRYADSPKKVTGYEISASETGGSQQVYNSAAGDSVFILSDFNTGSNYCFEVKAILEDGTRSSSNRVCITTNIRKAPAWINADYASVDDNGISLSFTIDPGSEISHFRLERKTGTGAFLEIAEPSAISGRVTYSDEDADTKAVNYYRLSAINQCLEAVTVSNVTSNIVLNIEEESGRLILRWNSPGTLPGSALSYDLFMNTGNGYEPETTIPSDTVCAIELKDIIYEISGSEVCFYVNANETNNRHGINGQRTSSKTCMSPGELITVPNLFTPNNDLRNDYFRPVLSFTPAEYQLIISNRQGKVLFETRDFHEEWDGIGTGSGEGVFLWFLKVRTPSGRIISKTGTVTVVK